MRIIIDTGAFYYPQALTRIPEDTPVVVPAVVLMERARQVAIKFGMSPLEFLRSIEERGWEVEGSLAGQAARAANLAVPLQADAWKRLARDAMVAAHVMPGDVLWTSNPRDFVAIGVPTVQILDVHVSE